MEKYSIVGYHFAMIHRMNAALCKHEITKLGIQVSHIPFLAKLLCQDHPLTQDELSALVCIDKGATARAITQLEHDGLVSRIVNPENRRQKLVSPTEKARNMEKSFFACLHNASDKITRDFSDEELQQAHTFLKRMLENAQDALK